MQNEDMIYGNARASADKQDLTGQLAQLTAAGCGKVFREKITKHHKQEARARVVAGETHRSVAPSYNVSHATISRLAA